MSLRRFDVCEQARGSSAHLDALKSLSFSCREDACWRGTGAALREGTSKLRLALDRAIAADVEELVAHIEVKEEELQDVGATSSMKVSQCVLQTSSWERLTTLMSGCIVSGHA
eukprot:3781751-Amphidinium_carterae.1